MRKQNFHIDWAILTLYMTMLLLGWLSLCGASQESGETATFSEFFSWNLRTGKQLGWIGLAFMLGFALTRIESNWFEIFADFFYWGMMVVLFLTPFIAKDIKGSRSWISLGAVSLQPAEFAKCATALMLSKFMGQFNFKLNAGHNFRKAIGYIILPMILIVMQRETGSALVYLVFFLVLYREGMSGSILVCAVAAIAYFVIGIKYMSEPLPGTTASVGQFVVLLLIGLIVSGMLMVYNARDRLGQLYMGVTIGVTLMAWLFSRFVVAFDIAWIQILLLTVMIAHIGFMALQGLRGQKSYILIGLFTLASLCFHYSSSYALENVMEPHQRNRIHVLLGTEKDMTGAGYNVNQSKIAIGSGGFSGKGFRNGTQTKLKYVPEQDTDFIYCTVGEEQGFVGSVVVLLLFLALIWRIIWLAERQDYTFARIYGYCVASIFLFHLFINVGMVLGLVPVIGIPLPFFSYGGSSLWGFTILLFIFVRLDSKRFDR